MNNHTGMGSLHTSNKSENLEDVWLGKASALPNQTGGY